MKNPTLHSPSPFIPTQIDPLEVKAQVSLYNTFKNFSQPSPEHYQHLAELYATQFDYTIDSVNTLINMEGAIAEMYLDIFKFEQDKGENERSRAQKTRVVVLQKGLEELRRYYNKYEQAKKMLYASLESREALKKENERLQKEIDLLNKQDNL